MPNDDAWKVTMIGNIHGVMYNKNGNQVDQIIPKRLKNGWSLHGNKDGIWIAKGQQKKLFGIIILTKEGLIFVVYIKRKVDREVANTKTDAHQVPTFNANVNKAHELLGHADKEKTCVTAKHLD
eukprot:5673982-Ditylum_brightwellii.AAC.1